jgi:hypothetical protein
MPVVIDEGLTTVVPETVVSVHTDTVTTAPASKPAPEMVTGYVAAVAETSEGLTLVIPEAVTVTPLPRAAEPPSAFVTVRL